MTRSDAAQEVKSRYAEYLTPAKKVISGKQSYICPLCGNGSGADGTGMTIDPHGDGTQLHCFKCGFHGDIIDLYQRENDCTTGEAFRALYNYFDLLIDDSPAAQRKAPQKGNNAPEQNNAAAGAEQPAENEPNYTEYYKICKARLKEDPAAQKYLSFRGISQETAAAYWIGYDPAADPANAPGAMGEERKPYPCGRIIIPFDKSNYLGRRTDNAESNKKMLNLGAHQTLFNRAALYNKDNQPVFIVEGAFDALSVIEAGGEAIALNSTSGKKEFIRQLEKQRTDNTLILSLDNDDAGQGANAELAEELDRLNISYFIGNISGKHKDPNEALTADRTAFIETVQRTVKKILYPGLLTPEFATSTLEAADGQYINIRRFPDFSDALKLRLHDTVVIAADTGAGKTSLMLNFIHDLQDKYPALYFNLENDTATVIQRLVAIHTGMELDRIEGYNVDMHTRAAVNEAIQEITARKDIQIIEDVYSLDGIERQIKRATRGRTEPTLVFIDTGLLVTVNNTTRYERFTKVSEELRRISRLNNVILFVLLQQNREGKKEEPQQWPPKSSTLNSSLKETGSWENDSTKVLFLMDNPLTQTKELFITKNRTGKRGRIRLAYQPHTQTYAEALDATFEEEGGKLGAARTQKAGRKL